MKPTLGKQFSLVPLHLGHHPSGYIPALGLVSEIVIRDDGFGEGPSVGRVSRCAIFLCSTSFAGSLMA